MIGIIIGTTIFGVLVIVAVILIISIRRSSRPSLVYLDDEESGSVHRQFTGPSSPKLATDVYADIGRDLKGDAFKTIYLCFFSFSYQLIYYIVFSC